MRKHAVIYVRHHGPRFPLKLLGMFSICQEFIFSALSRSDDPIVVNFAGVIDR